MNWKGRYYLMFYIPLFCSTLFFTIVPFFITKPCNPHRFEDLCTFCVSLNSSTYLPRNEVWLTVCIVWYIVGYNSSRIQARITILCTWDDGILKNTGAGKRSCTWVCLLELLKYLFVVLTQLQILTSWYVVWSRYMVH